MTVYVDCFLAHLTKLSLLFNIAVIGCNQIQMLKGIMAALHKAGGRLCEYENQSSSLQTEEKQKSIVLNQSEKIRTSVSKLQRWKIRMISKFRFMSDIIQQNISVVAIDALAIS